MLTALMAAVSSPTLAACENGNVDVLTFVRDGAVFTVHGSDENAYVDLDGSKCPVTQWVEDDMSVALVSCDGTEYPIVIDNGAAEFAGKIYQRKCP